MRQLVRQDRKAGSLAHSARRSVSLVRKSKLLEAVHSRVHIGEGTRYCSVNAPCTGEVKRFDSCLAYRLQRPKFLCVFHL